MSSLELSAFLGSTSQVVGNQPVDVEMRPAPFKSRPTLVLTTFHGGTVIPTLTDEQQKKFTDLYTKFMQAHKAPDNEHFSFDFLQLISEDAKGHKTHQTSDNPATKELIKEMRTLIASILDAREIEWREIPTGTRAHLSAEPNFALKQINFDDKEHERLKDALGIEHPVEMPRVYRAESLITQIRKKLTDLKDHSELKNMPPEQGLVKQGRLQAIDGAIESLDQSNKNAVYFAVGCPDAFSAKERFQAAERYFEISPNDFGIKDRIKISFGYELRDPNKEYLADAARLHCDTRAEYEIASFELGKSTEFRRDGVEVFLTRLTKAGDDQDKINAVLNNEHLFAAAFGDLHQLDQDVLRKSLSLLAFADPQFPGPWIADGESAPSFE